MPDKFIRPCEAIKILEISRETLRRNYKKMKIRRTIEKPYLYSKSDCLNWRIKRFEFENIVENPNLQRRIRRLTKKKTA